MSRRNIKNCLIVALFITYIILYRLVVFPNYMKISEIISASFVVVMLALSIKMLGFRKDKPSVLSKNITKIVLFYIIITFFIMYGLGILVGFLQNAYSHSFTRMFDNILSPLIIILCIELIRYVVIWANKDKKLFIVLFTFVLVVFEIVLNVRTFNFNDLETIFRLTATVILPILIKNTLLSYLCYHIGYKVPILYRVIMDLYIFIVPIVPDLGEYINCMILISLPFVIYISSFTMIDNRIKNPEPVFNYKNFTLLDIPVTALLVVMIGLISGFFPHYMIGIGSESMVPAINKGDAVIIKKVNKDTNIKKNQIIAYEKDGKIVVHRVKSIRKDKDNIYYTTKGDANGGNDPSEVKTKQVKGVVKLRIPFIAYPTVWLSELFNS